MRVDHRSVADASTIGVWHYDEDGVRTYVLAAVNEDDGRVVSARFDRYTLRDFATGLLDMLAMEENRV